MRWKGKAPPYNLLMDKLNRFRHEVRRIVAVYVVTVSRVLAALLIFSLVVLIAHDFLFVGWAELFTGGAALWDLFYRLCFAFVASFIFYFVVIHRGDQRKKEALPLRVTINGLYTLKSFWRDCISIQPCFMLCRLPRSPGSEATLCPGPNA
jgi:hypothetical protein